MSEENKAAAESYRRQRQRADALRNGFAYTAAAGEDWFSNNESLMRAIIKANGVGQIDVERTIEDYKAHLTAMPPGSEYDDKNARAILRSILEDIENLCREQKIPIRNGVVYGIAPEFGLLASQRDVMETGVSIIELSMPFIVFCNAVSKALARTLIHEEGQMIKVCNDPEAVRAKLSVAPELTAEWTRLITRHALNWPPARLSPAPDRLGQVTRILLLKAMEWFALAHEYGHHVMMHGQATSSSASRNIFDDEHEADLFARAASMALGDRAQPMNMYALFGVGGVIVLAMLDLVRRARSVLKTGLDVELLVKTHPPVAERVHVFGLLDQHLPEDLRPAAKDMRDCFMKIIEGIWEEVLPIIETLHKDGIRPLEPAADGQDWLPK